MGFKHALLTSPLHSPSDDLLRNREIHLQSLLLGLDIVSGAVSGLSWVGLRAHRAGYLLPGASPEIALGSM